MTAPASWEDAIKFDEGGHDGEVVVLTNARFELDPNYNEGQTLLLKIDVTKQGAAEGTTEQWNCGSVDAGWAPIEGGAAAERGEKPESNFNPNSKVAALISSMLEIDDLAELLKGRFADGAAPLGPRSAAFYDNLIVRFERTVKTFTIEGEQRESRNYIVSEFVGEYDGGAPAKAPAKGKTKAKAADDDEPATKKPTKAQRQTIDDLADEAADFAELLDQLAESDLPEAVVAYVAAEGEDGEIWTAAIERYEASEG